ncbi:GL12883 [Drosophila persimilis]|uniref:GL12883 n=1 Tax=Drosophila persimilis TaxID=7234 RepID=B4GV96_DROPE|nr:GL12883 [Drosophila persimilis]
MNASHENPVLWDSVHLRKLLADEYEVVDTVLEQLNQLKFTAGHCISTDPDVPL